MILLHLIKIIKFIFFYPLGIIYGLCVRTRNLLYDLNIIKTYKFNKPIIVIGNIHVGGTGKTPMIMYLLKGLEKQFNIAIISRGYKRKTTGFKEVYNDISSTDSGDEALMIKQCFNSVSVYVSKNRVKAIQKLQNEHEVFLLDDGFQHRRLTAGLNIILIPYKYILTQSFFMPYGRQRDSFTTLKRADIVLITKSPKNIIESAERKITTAISKYNQFVSIYFSYIDYLGLISFNPSYDNIDASVLDSSYTIILLTAIASDEEIINFLKAKNCTIINYRFRDHYYYTNADINKILNMYVSLEAANKIILTTQKDYTKLKELDSIKNLGSAQCYYLDFCIKINNNKGAEFIQIILNYISKYYNN